MSKIKYTNKTDDKAASTDKEVEALLKSKEKDGEKTNDNNNNN